jgi:hypothetical protein
MTVFFLAGDLRVKAENRSLLDPMGSKLLRANLALIPGVQDVVCAPIFGTTTTHVAIAIDDDSESYRERYGALLSWDRSRSFVGSHIQALVEDWTPLLVKGTL